MGARDLDKDMLRQTFRDFIDSVAKAGPDAVAAVYFAGYGLQLDSENYLLAHFPGHIGLRFSPNALRPSLASSVSASNAIWLSV
jgi:hypothetical protein